MATTVLPEHKVLESPNSRTILINNWEITASTNPISNAFELDQMHAQLDVPLPEMTFGSNFLTLQHLPSTWAYIFTAEHALRAVKNGELEEGDGGVKVGYADAWLKSRCVSRSDRPSTSATFMSWPGAAWIPRRRSRCRKPSRPNRMTGRIPPPILDTPQFRAPTPILGGLPTPRTHSMPYRLQSSLDQTRSYSTPRSPSSTMNCMITALPMCWSG